MPSSVKKGGMATKEVLRKKRGEEAKTGGERLQFFLMILEKWVYQAERSISGAGGRVTVGSTAEGRENAGEEEMGDCVDSIKK